MTRHILSAGLVVLLGSAGIGASDATGSAAINNESLKVARIHPEHVRGIAISGEGQIDPETLDVTLDGEASHVGRFTSTGAYIADQQKFQGVMTASQGDVLSYDMWIYADGDIHGIWPCTIDLRGIVGDFTRAVAEGTITVNDDGSFTFDLAGSVEPPPPTDNSAHEIAIRGEGQIDPGPWGVTFAGVASRLGRFTAIGELAGEQVRGTITISADDSFYYVVTFGVASDIHGTHPCSINMSGNGERYRYTRSSAEGTCTVEDDGSFSFDLDGIIWTVVPPPPCFSEPCLDGF